MDKVAGGSIAISGTYCVLQVDGVLEWVCYAILTVLIIWIGNKLLNIFQLKKPKKQTKTPKDTDNGFN